MTNPQGHGTEFMTEEQARRKLAHMEAELARQTHLAERAFSHNVMLAQDRLAFARQQQAETEKMMDQLEPLKERPDAAYVYSLVGLQSAVYGSVVKMMEVDIDCNSFNLEMVESPSMLENENFREAEKYLTFKKAQLRLNLSLAYFFWMRDCESIDTLLRAAINGRSIEPSTPEEEARRKQSAEVLREEFKTNRDMAIFAGTMATGYNEAFELMQWGVAALPDLETRNAQVLRELLNDVRWAKLNGKLQTVMLTVAERCKPYPALSRLFPVAPPVELPFASVNEPQRVSAGLRGPGAQTAEKSQTGPLSGTGPLGRTGPLSVSGASKPGLTPPGRPAPPSPGLGAPRPTLGTPGAQPLRSGLGKPNPLRPGAPGAPGAAAPRAPGSAPLRPPGSAPGVGPAKSGLGVPRTGPLPPGAQRPPGLGSPPLGKPPATPGTEPDQKPRP